MTAPVLTGCREPSRTRQLCGHAGMALAAAVAGAGIAAVGAHHGPWLVLLAVGVVAAGAAVLRDLSLAAVGLVLVLPIGLQPAGPVRVVQLAAAAVVGLVVAVGVGTGKRWRAPAAVVVALGAVLALGGLAAGASSAPGVSVPALLQFALGGAAMLAVAASVDTVAQLRRLVTVLVVVGAGISAAAVLSVGQVSASYGGAAVRGRVEGIFGHPNELGAFTAALLVLALGLWLGSRTRGSAAMALGCALLVLAALVLSLSRGAWFGAAAGVLALVALGAGLHGARRRLATLGISLSAVVVGAAVVFRDHPLLGVVAARLGSVAGSDSNPNDARPEIYDEAVRLVQAHPLLGQGPGTFPASYAGTAPAGRAADAEHAHNVVLTLGVELGLLGLVAIAALCIAVLMSGRSAVRRMRRDGDHASAALCAGALGALVTVLAHGIVDYPLRNPLLFLLHWVVAGLVLGYVHAARSAAVETARSALR